MAWTFHSATEANNFSFTLSGTSFGGAFSAAVGAGDLLLALVSFQSNTGSIDVTSVTDTSGNTWHRIQISKNRGDGQVVGAWYAIANANSTPTVTFNFNGNTSVGAWEIASFTGPGTPSLAASSTNQNNTGTVASSSVTSVGTDDLVVGFCIGSGNTISALSGFTETSGATGTPMVYAEETTPAAYSPGINISNGEWAAIAADFTSVTPPPPIPDRPFTSNPSLPPIFSRAEQFSAPPKFGLIVAAPVTLDNWTPTTGQKAVILNYAQPDWQAPSKFGLVTIAPALTSSWTPTEGKKAVQLNYSQIEIAHPDKYGLTSVVQTLGFVNLAGAIQFAITPGGYIKVVGMVLQPARQFVRLAGAISTRGNLSFINLAGRVQVSTRSFVKLSGVIYKGSRGYIELAGSIANRIVFPTSFIKLSGTIVQKLTTGACGNFPDRSFINLAGWIVNPVSTNDSRQMPGQGFTTTDDWLSSNDALNSYKPTSRFTIFGSTLPSAGISLLVTAFTAGVVSFQTRTRGWLRRVDQANSGILVNSKVNTHTLPNGTLITTTTQTTQNQDILTTLTTIQNSGTPTRTSTIITEKKGSGQTTTREIETDTVNGIINSQEKKNVFTNPPTFDNPQPLQVRTLDGVIHYQFFDVVNAEWAGGDQEGLTTTNRQTQIVPGTLNGKTTDAFGNLIYNQMTDVTETDPSGKLTHTHTEEIGTRRDIGTTTTDTTQQFNGLLVITTKTENYPDGSQKVTNTTTNPVSGDSTQTTTETVTDEYNQVTTTVTNEETKIFTDPVSGLNRQTVTKTVNVTKGGVTTTDNSVDTTTDFEDDIIRNKVKVYFIQEFTISCVIDEFSMMALSEINITHQKNYALLELFGQQLGNANLSYLLRQQLINQFNQANACLIPFTLQALGRNYKTVFAQSASGFRAKYIPGTEPHVYELQMIVQERSDLINGAFGGG